MERPPDLPPLGDVRVLDLATGAGALAASLLGDFGADVIKVVDADPREGRGGGLPDWIAWNRSKRIATRRPGRCPRSPPATTAEAERGKNSSDQP